MILLDFISCSPYEFEFESSSINSMFLVGFGTRIN